MLLLFSNPRIGSSLALEAGISAGESTEFIDVDGERAVRFRDDPIISHPSNMAALSGVRKPVVKPQRQPVIIKLTHYPDPFPADRC